MEKENRTNCVAPSSRPTIDLSTALSAPVVPLYKERITVLEAELEALEEENGREQARLRSSIATESGKREDAKRALDLLDDVGFSD